MRTFVDMINRYLTILGVPGTRVLGAAAIIALAVSAGVYAVWEHRGVWRAAAEWRTRHWCSCGAG